LAKKITAALLTVVIIVIGIMAVVGIGKVPDDLYVIKGETPVLFRAPYIKIRFENDEAAKTGAVPGGSYDARAELFGIIPIKNINVSFVERRTVSVCGIPIGIKLNAKGVIVAEMTDVITENGNVNPGCECGLKPGDCIISVNGAEISTASQLIDTVEKSSGNTLVIDVLRQDGSKTKLMLRPVLSETDGCYRAGIWIRNGTAGIGVLTFCDSETGMFGGLGHAICDENSGAIMSVSNGEITSVMLTEIIKGASGAPGEVVGFLGDQKYGTLTKNTAAGIYGYIEQGVSLGNGEYEVALKQEVKEGKAKIITAVPGSDGVQEYEISIEKINYDADNPTRNMIVKVTDKELLELTGGIVQGMSGSPIIQNGRIVGAVTHVLVNDPTSGYGIFIENMLEAAA